MFNIDRLLGRKARATVGDKHQPQQVTGTIQGAFLKPDGWPLFVIEDSDGRLHMTGCQSILMEKTPSSLADVEKSHAKHP